MKRVIYICDQCKREFPYELKLSDKDRSMLLDVYGFDLCRECVKKVKEFICQKK